MPVKMALNHGVSLSCYFDDPEGHLIEVYCSRPVMILMAIPAGSGWRLAAVLGRLH